MTDPAAKPSLIQQRMTLTRTRNFAVLATVATIFLLSAQIIRLVDSGENSAWHWFGVAVFAVLMGAAVVSVVKADRAIRSFEAENGRDAGRQRPVGDRWTRPLTRHPGPLPLHGSRRIAFSA